MADTTSTLPTLFILLGPTGVGKTELSIALARRLNSPVISADSRQVFRELPIGSAMPPADCLSAVRHYFIATRSVTEKYSAGQYEADVLHLTDTLFLTHDSLLMVGGSMMYIDAVCRGFDDVPAIDESVRRSVQDDMHHYGLDYLLDELRRVDEEHYQRVDRQNYRRVMRAIEVCRQTHQPYSSFRRGHTAERPFRIVKIGLNRPRPELYQRINQRVDVMLRDGLIDEARQLTHLRHLPALNTVGYKELFPYFDGMYSLDHAIQLIKQDTRHYAKRQLTWFRADSAIRWFHPDDLSRRLTHATADMPIEMLLTDDVDNTM